MISKEIVKFVTELHNDTSASFSEMRHSAELPDFVREAERQGLITIRMEDDPVGGEATYISVTDFAVQSLDLKAKPSILERLRSLFVSDPAPTKI